MVTRANLGSTGSKVYDVATKVVEAYLSGGKEKETHGVVEVKVEEVHVEAKMPSFGPGC